MKKQLPLLIMFLGILGTKAFAYDIAVENADGVTIYYKYINDGTELEVTYKSTDYNYNIYRYSVVIPEEVTYMNRTRKVTSIGDYAFRYCSGLTSVTIPNSVTSIKIEAFYGCVGLTSITIPNSVTSIWIKAFYNCTNLTTVAIGNSLTSIGGYVFYGCSSLASITIPNGVTGIGYAAFAGCSSLTSVTIPNSVTAIEAHAFANCRSLTSITIPNSVTGIGYSAFGGCTGLTSVMIPNSVKNIEDYAFYKCTNLTSVTIPNSVTSIGENAFGDWDLPVIISKIENPFKIYGKNNSTRTFSINTFNNATLYVPVGTIDKYKSTEGWKDFIFIEEGDGDSETPSNPKKCEKPTITYSNGKLMFNCSTEGATCQYSITDSDIKAGNSNEVQLSVTYNISIYAAKSGYENSETVTATLCWIDVDPKTEGITNEIANVPANAVLIQSNGGQLTIEGANDGEYISVYNINGTQEGSATSNDGSAVINTNLQPGNIAIVRIAQKSVKVVVK